jgi:hypothetical protein
VSPQISTRSEDFLIDVLDLRHAMHVLAPAFANPKIVKVGTNIAAVLRACCHGCCQPSAFDSVLGWYTLEPNITRPDIL